MLDFQSAKPVSGGKPSHLVVVLHGLGDSGRGLMGLGAAWMQALPQAEFIYPDAPFPFDAMPQSGRQWFPLRLFSKDEIHDGVLRAAPYLDRFIDHVIKIYGLPAEKIALAGFSQGAMMALYAGPRRAQKLAGVIGYAGLLVGGESLAAEIKSKPPIFLIHGTDDQVVPYAAMEPSAQGLRAAGLAVGTHSCKGLGHGIDDEALGQGLGFLKTVLV